MSTNHIIFCKILPTYYSRKCMEISLMNLFVDTGAKKVTQLLAGLQAYKR